MARGDTALGMAEVGATGLAKMLWPLPHRVMMCWGGWKLRAQWVVLPLWRFSSPAAQPRRSCGNV